MYTPGGVPQVCNIPEERGTLRRIVLSLLWETGLKPGLNLSGWLMLIIPVPEVYSCPCAKVLSVAGLPPGLRRVYASFTPVSLLDLVENS